MKFEVQKVVDIDVKDCKIQEDSAQEMELIDDNEKLILKRIRINSNIKDLDKSLIQNELMDLVKKYESVLTDSSIEVFIRLLHLGTQYQKLIYTRILVVTSKERFDVSAEHRNIKLSFYKALYRLENQLSKKNITIEIGPKRFPYNSTENSSYKGVSNKIILRKVHNEVITET